MASNTENVTLKKSLTAINLWAIGVGIVISGSYFGWNFGVGESGFLGMLIATLLMATLYITMTLGISELSTILPHAGGPYSFARRSMGRYVGFITGIGVLLQYIMAGPVVAIGIGGYVNFLFPEIPALVPAAIIFGIFMIVHIIGIKEYATIEMVLCSVAVGLLVLFFIVGLPYIHVENLFPSSGKYIPGGFKGIWSALPYAMWLFLAIEMLPMLSEETRDVNKDMPKGLISGVTTLLIISIFTITVSIGLGGIDKISVASDPLPASIASVLGETYWLSKVLATVGLVGLVSSCSGVILAYSRQVYSLARAGYLPKFLSLMNKKRQTPYVAIILPGVLGILLVFFFNPNNLILISTFGALVSYIAMNLSVIILRIKEPNLVRSFKTPFYPITPIVSLILCVVAIFASFFANLPFFFVCIAIFALASLYYFIWARHQIDGNAPEENFMVEEIENSSLFGKIEDSKSVVEIEASNLIRELK